MNFFIMLTIIADQIEACCWKESYKQSNREEYVQENLDFPELLNCIDLKSKFNRRYR